MEARDLRPSLARAAAEPYRKAGLFARKFAQGKLTRDPSYMGILERSLLPGGDRLLDLGCGQGLIAAWLNAARATADPNGDVFDRLGVAINAMLDRNDERATCEPRRASPHARYRSEDRGSGQAPF